MPREKKPEGQKFKTMTFSLHPDLLISIKEKAKNENVNLSTMLSKYLELWVHGQMAPDTEIKSITNDINQYATNQNQAMPPEAGTTTPDEWRLQVETRLRNLEEMAISTLPRMDETAMGGSISNDATVPHVGSPGGTTPQPEENPVQSCAMNLSPSGGKERRVLLTEEMRRELEARIRTTGKTYSEVSELTGVIIPTIKKVCNSNNPPKSLSCVEYDTLSRL